MLDVQWQQCWRGDQCDVCPEHTKSLNVASCDPAVFDIANDRQIESTQILNTKSLTNCKTVHQCLRWVLMCAIASIDNRCVCPLRNLPRHTNRFVAHNKGINTHVGDGLDCVAQTFAFVDARCGNTEIHCFCRQPLGCSFKTQSCSSRVFEKQTHHRLATQRRHLRH